MPGIRKGKRAGKYQDWYHTYDSGGKRKERIYFTGTASSRETLTLAHEHDLRERRIALGLEAPPAEEYLDATPYADVVDAYLEWEKSGGGRKGCPWNADHLQSRARHLQWWQEYLGLACIADLYGCTDKVRATRQELRREGRSNKTAAHYVEALRSLCVWAVERGYLEHDPIGKLGPGTQVRRCAGVLSRFKKSSGSYRLHLRIVALTSLPHFSQG